MIFIWIFIGCLIYYLIKSKGGLNTRAKNNNAAEILKKRFVKGEIDDETFNRMMKIIKG